MRYLIVSVGVVLGLASCCCPSARDPYWRCAGQGVEAPSRSAASDAVVTAHHYVGDLILSRLTERTEQGMSTARHEVAASVRMAAGADLDLRAEWSVLVVEASSVVQSLVATTLASMRLHGAEGSVSERPTPSAGSAHTTSRVHDVSDILQKLPRVEAVGEGGSEEIPRETTLLDAVHEQVASVKDGPGPSMYLHDGSLVVEAPQPIQDQIASWLEDTRTQLRALDEK